MEIKFVSRSPGASRLLLFFAGWGMDATPFAALNRNGYDVAVVWDYRSTSFDAALAEPYEEVCVLAWSLGVAAADASLEPIAHKITRRVAVNGTLHPVSDSLGIPPNIYYGTREGLDGRNLVKFYRRMFASRAEYAVFAAAPPARGIAGLRDELTAVAALSADTVETPWDCAYISAADAIIPAEAQRRAWAGEALRKVELPGAHWADFQAIIDREFIDKSTMRERFTRHRDSYEAAGAVQAEVVDTLLDVLNKTLPLGQDVSPAAQEILEIGCGSGMLSRRLARLFPEAHLTLCDIAAAPPQGLPDSRCRFVCADAEVFVAGLPSRSIDAIFSASTVQWFNSPHRFFEQCSRVLRHGALMAISTFVRGNLAEISNITGHALPLPDAQGWLDMLPEELQVLHSHHWDRSITFASPAEALRHLRLTGVNSLGGSARQLLRNLPPRQCTLTYRPMVLILKKI